VFSLARHLVESIEPKRFGFPTVQVAFCSQTVTNSSLSAEHKTDLC